MEVSLIKIPELGAKSAEVSAELFAPENTVKGFGINLSSCINELIMCSLNIQKHVEPAQSLTEPERALVSVYVKTSIHSDHLSQLKAEENQGFS
ncbi:MAG: hypothetical protein HGB23_10155 [Chlorobiaceae bacterium]|nr:hypothetical protein [Chlorobiaceae bacterium]